MREAGLEVGRGPGVEGADRGRGTRRGDGQDVQRRATRTGTAGLADADLVEKIEGDEAKVSNVEFVP